VSSSKYYPPGAQLDFRVMAGTGYMYDEMAGRPIMPQYALRWSERSDYSKTQAFTVPDIYSSTTTTTPSQTTNITSPYIPTEDVQIQSPDQTQPPLLRLTNPIVLLMITILFTGIIVTIVMIFRRQHLKNPNFSKDFPQTNILQTTTTI